VSVLDGPLLGRFLELAGERLRGDWVVIGGCVLPLRGIELRTTVDIEVAGPDTAGTRDTLLLLEIAEELGLPVEAINQAGALFLKRIPDWESNLIEVHRGTGAVIHIHCIAMLGLARDRREAFDAERVSQAIQAALASGVPPERARRLRSLEAVVVRLVRNADQGG